ncbi:MAG: DUF2911 domain-containing protein [Sediminicola sp.]|tara:strand:+ start:69884 stop:70429 length:546 start_codon:yes stop_codon:yes gene_type:complete
MKKVTNMIALAAMVVFTSTAMAQKFSGLDKSPADIATFPANYKVADKYAKIVYGRPQLKGRSLAELAPAGEVWRTGANEAAEITFYKDVTLGGKDVKAGTYSLFTIPGAKEWTLILNSNLNQWGAYSYEESADVIRIPAEVSSGKESVEAFSIMFDEADKGANLIMGWGTVRVTAPIEVKM